jgi:cytochrome c oxidase subunit IV
MSESSGHVVPYRTFVLTWLGLIVLTGITIAVSLLDFGVLNVWIALGIASTKAGLVIFIFMHMKYERLYYRVYMFITLVILAIFIGLTFADVYYR